MNLTHKLQHFALSLRKKPKAMLTLFAKSRRFFFQRDNLLTLQFGVRPLAHARIHARVAAGQALILLWTERRAESKARR